MISIANFCILVPTWTKDASIIADSVYAPETHASNLLNIRPPYFFRSKQCECVHIIASVRDPREWNALYLGYTNSSTATIRVASGNTFMTLFDSPDFDSGLQEVVGGHFFLQTPHIQASRYIGIEIGDKDNPDGFFQAGIFQAGMMPQIEQSPFIDDCTPPYEHIYPGMSMIVRPRRRDKTFNIRFMVHSDVRVVESMMSKHEGRTPMVFKWDRLWDDECRQIAIYSFASWRQWPDEIRIKEL